MNLNVTDLRKQLRRSSGKKKSIELSEQERRKAERRVLAAESSDTEDNIQRIWLTPGERTLIEDLYLLEKDK